MLSLSVTISGDKVVIAGLNQLAAELPNAIQRGLKTVARGVHRGALDWLEGSGGFNTYETRTSRSGKQYQKKTGTKLELYDGFTRASGETQTFKRFSDSGGYPVPIRTRNLYRLMSFIDPGQSKGIVSAGPLEVVVYNSAEYARTIHEGGGSSAKFGRRPFLEDALKKFNGGEGVAQAIENEIAVEIKKRGLA